MHQERPLLVSRRACSRTLKGVFRNLEWPPLYLRTMKIAYKHTLLNPPNQPCLIHNPTLNCPHIQPVSSPNPLFLVYEIMVYHHQPHSLSSPNLLLLVYEIMVYHPQTHSLSSTTPFCSVYEAMVYHPQTQSLSPTNSLRIVYKLILYHPLPHGISSTNSSCALSKPSLHCLRPNVLYSFAQGLLLQNTQKKKKQKTTVFYFFFFNLYFSFYTPYA